jgi:hypothetical protein
MADLSRGNKTMTFAKSGGRSLHPPSPSKKKGSIPVDPKALQAEYELHFPPEWVAANKRSFPGCTLREKIEQDVINRDLPQSMEFSTKSKMRH